jgi:hypothetical protein
MFIVNKLYFSINYAALLNISAVISSHNQGVSHKKASNTTSSQYQCVVLEIYIKLVWKVFENYI